MNLEIGTNVVCVKENDITYKKKGVILSMINGYYNVAFEDFTDGHSLDGLVFNTGWTLHKNDLLVNKINPLDAIYKINDIKEGYMVKKIDTSSYGFVTKIYNKSLSIKMMKEGNKILDYYDFLKDYIIIKRIAVGTKIIYYNHEKGVSYNGIVKILDFNSIYKVGIELEDFSEGNTLNGFLDNSNGLSVKYQDIDPVVKYEKDDIVKIIGTNGTFKINHYNSSNKLYEISSITKGNTLMVKQENIYQYNYSPSINDKVIIDNDVKLKGTIVGFKNKRVFVDMGNEFNGINVPDIYKSTDQNCWFYKLNRIKVYDNYESTLKTKIILDQIESTKKYIVDEIIKGNYSVIEKNIEYITISLCDNIYKIHYDSNNVTQIKGDINIHITEYMIERILARS